MPWAYIRSLRTIHEGMKKSQTILYINFSPYENAGNILNFIKKSFSRVIMFSFNFHRLDSHQPPSTLTVFEYGKNVYQTRLYQTPTSPELAFLLLPIRSGVIFLQLLFHTILLRNRFGPYDIFFTVNAFIAWCGNILRSLGIVSKTIFWVWDYYPPFHPDRLVRFMRWLYWQFDKPASRSANKTFFLNKRLEILRKKIGVLPQNSQYEEIEIGTNPLQTNRKKSLLSISLVFFGVIKRSQGLDLFFDAFAVNPFTIPVILHVIGGGPDLEYFRLRAKSCRATVIFHGFVRDDNKVDKIIDMCLIGLAPYPQDKSNVMYYSDPSKIKRYISRGLPVITTDVFEFSSNIQKYNAGVIISYEKQQIIPSIELLLKNYSAYSRNALSLARKYSYTNLYERLFRD